MGKFNDDQIVGGIGARHVECAERGERSPGEGGDENARFLYPPFHVLADTRGHHAGPLQTPSNKQSDSMIALGFPGI